VGKHFLGKATFENFIATGAAYSTSIIALRSLTKTFYISQHKMKVTIVTSGWVKSSFEWNVWNTISKILISSIKLL